jgi:hypothetical protein
VGQNKIDKVLFGVRVLMDPKSPLISKNMFGTRVLGEFNSRQSPLFPKF